MGSTLEVLLIIKDNLYIAHVGDSRVYRIRNREITKLTTDHSYVQKLVNDGKITKEQSLHHPDKNMITKAIGTEVLVEPELLHEKLLADDYILVCSDGLTNMLSDDEIKDIVLNTKEGENIAEELVDNANKRGGLDNTTVILIKY